MREILFRAKKKDGGVWVRGYIAEIETAWDRYELGSLPTEYEKVIIRTDLCTREACAIIPETVGQYTGLVDKNGEKIFEGDIIHSCGGEFCQGYWEYDSIFEISNLLNPFKLLELEQSENIEIIGNIFDNPELLEGE